MKKVLNNIYYFLPVQLLLLHFRKYQFLLLFWVILFLTVTGRFASHFGASSLFLAPEYIGHISFLSMLLLGGATCVFIMMWHITTFIIHSKRMPYMGATRHAFVVYCYNNSIIPIVFLDFYSVKSIQFQWYNEHASVLNIIILQLGFYLGITLVIFISFAYFFRVSRDFFKSLLTTITNPARIREIIPYDSLDYELDILPAQSYISGKLKIELSADLEPFHPRVMNTVLRRHHRNVIFATIIAYAVLLILGIFMERPLLRIPAGGGFLLLFSIIMGIVGAFKYFMKSWEAIGWIIFAILLTLMVKFNFFDLRSVAYGLNYHTHKTNEPRYDYEHVHALFTTKRFEADKKTEEHRLDLWKNKNTFDSAKPPIVVVTVSGGGSRSAYWTFRTLQYIDSMTNGRLFKNTTLVTGASGGMIGAAYWRNLHDAYQQGLLKNPYLTKYQRNIGKDLLNAIIFSFASVDLISPFNRIKVAGYSYTRDRGYAMEQELIRNTDSLMNKNIGYYKNREANADIPLLIINGTIVNDGRRLMISNLPVGYLTQPEYSLNDSTPPIDAIDFAAFFAKQDPYNLRIATALRMNATFPYILPVVKLPSQPNMDIMDAGLRDNFGAEVASRYLYVLRDWLGENTREIIFLDIRDTRENTVTSPSEQSSSLSNMIVDPVFVIQNKWEAFQSYSQTIYQDLETQSFKGKLRYITLEYIPREANKTAALNFHLTQQEKQDIYHSIYNASNQAAIDTIVKLLKTPNP